MFVLVIVEDILSVPPSELGDVRTAVAARISAKYQNKVILSVGLGIALYDLLWLGDANLVHSEPCARVKTKFRLVVFRPFVGETIVGKIIRSTPQGVQSMMFSVVLMLTTPSSQEEKLWVWNYNNNDLFMESQVPVRFKVETIRMNPPISKKFVRQEIDEACSLPKELLPHNAQANKLAATPVEEVKVEKEETPTEIDDAPPESKPPVLIIGTMAESGLGMVHWWRQEKTIETEEVIRAPSISEVAQDLSEPSDVKMDDEEDELVDDEPPIEDNEKDDE